MSIRILALAAMLLSLAACGGEDWFGEAGDPVLPGKRLAVLMQNTQLQVDGALAEEPMQLPPAIAHTFWPMSGGFSSHAMQHLGLSRQSLRMVWSVSAGSGNSGDGFLTSAPIAALGKVFTIDTGSVVRAFDLKSGKEYWERDLTPDYEDDTVASGGLATDGQSVFATTGHAELSALALNDGRVLWRQPVSSPIRSAPTVIEGKVIFTAVDNRLMALSAKQGLLTWMHEGLNESASLLGGASPAVDSGVVVAAFSSGELQAFRLDTGRLLWSESLSRLRRGSAMDNITTINALPVIVEGIVFAIGHNDRSMAIDLQNGQRLWDIPLGGTQTPWIAGKNMFVIGNGGQLIALDALSGGIRWITNLNIDAEKSYRFAGPVLAGEKLYVTGTNEQLMAISPSDGKILEVYDLPGPASLPPIVVDNTLLVLTDNARLAAFQ